MAVGDAHVFPGFLTPVLTQVSLQSHRLLFSHVSADVRGENTPGRKLASTEKRTHNHQVMSPTRSPLSYPGGAWNNRTLLNIFTWWQNYTTVNKKYKNERDIPVTYFQELIRSKHVHLQKMTVYEYYENWTKSQYLKVPLRFSVFKVLQYII